MQLKKFSKQKGFTLIEMLVSVALFSVVLTVTLGSILTIADSNKKARSLMSVTNNLNFAVDSMVRSFKSGNIDNTNQVVSTGTNEASGFGGASINEDNCFDTDEIDYNVGNFTTRKVRYCGIIDPNGIGRITKKINGTGGTIAYLTSPDVNIEFLQFQAQGTGTGVGQPILTIVIAGTVKVSEKISSKFAIQTSVSQLKLKI